MTLSRFRSHTGFTLVELMVGMTIFAIGLTGIYALLVSTMRHAMYSRHEIVVANLLREEMELVKNIRDTNVRNFLPWNRVYLKNDPIVKNKTFASGVYIIENDFAVNKIFIDSSNGNITNSPVYVKDITTDFQVATTPKDRYEESALYIDSKGRYTHVTTSTGTPYASYVIITPMQFTDANGTPIKIEDATSTPASIKGYVIDARVIVHTNGVYREYDAKTAITDWIR